MIKLKVAAAKARMTDAQVADISHYIPDAAWVDFIYLDSLINLNNIPREPFRGYRTDDTVSRLLTQINLTPCTSSGVVFSVRDHDPRLAEIYASALVAAYKVTDDRIHRQSAQLSVGQCADVERRARNDLHQAQDKLARFRAVHQDVFLPEQVSLSVRAQDAMRREIRAFRGDIADIDAKIAACTDRRNIASGGIDTAIDEQYVRLSDHRKGLAARLAVQESEVARLAKVVASVPAATMTSQVLNTNVSMANQRYQAASERLAVAKDELAQLESAGCLSVRYWAGTGGTAEHPEAPARMTRPRRTWMTIFQTMFLSVIGSSAVFLGAAYLNSGLREGKGTLPGLSSSASETSR